LITLVVISGRSGSGKSTALHVLEDMGFYCIDNLPITLLKPLVDHLPLQPRLAVSIDARNIGEDLLQFPKILKTFNPLEIQVKVVFLDSSSSTLVKRFSETRRKHPLSDGNRDLQEALDFESTLLEPIAHLADLAIDTTLLSMHELRDLVRSRVAIVNHEFALLFQSFAYKTGVPIDADLLFDARCLTNPHWKPNLRNLTGKDEAVQEFLQKQPEVVLMYNDILGYLESWLPKFEANNRSYMTVAIGCTGGQHRSVYIADKLYYHFQKTWKNVQIRHRELSKIE